MWDYIQGSETFAQYKGLCYHTKIKQCGISTL
jgi:hypothetical protein